MFGFIPNAQNMSTSIYCDVNLHQTILYLGPSRILGLASQISTNDNLSRTPRHNNSVSCAKCQPPSTVMSTSIKQYFFYARSMSATNQYQLIWHVILHSVRSSALWRGVMTRPKHTWKVPGNTTPSLYLHQKCVSFLLASPSSTVKGQGKHNMSLIAFIY